MDVISLLKNYLEPENQLFEIVALHSRHVSEKALKLAEKHPEMDLDKHFIAEAAMLHDIGVCRTYAPDIHCYGDFPYICHGYLGREILEKEGFPKHALVCERHTGTGLFLTEIISKNLPLPHRDLVPVSLEEQLICFADKFFSKMQLNVELTPGEVRLKLIKYGSEGLKRFDRWCERFL